MGGKWAWGWGGVDYKEAWGGIFGFMEMFIILIVVTVLVSN